MTGLLTHTNHKKLARYSKRWNSKQFIYNLRAFHSTSELSLIFLFLVQNQGRKNFSPESHQRCLLPHRLSQIHTNSTSLGQTPRALWLPAGHASCCGKARRSRHSSPPVKVQIKHTAHTFCYKTRQETNWHNYVQTDTIMLKRKMSGGAYNCYILTIILKLH